MYFNPLFMQTTSVEDPTQNIKQLKLSKDSYLFSDIIKLNYEKSKVGESDVLGSTGINDLANVVSSGTVIKKEDVLDSFVGMPSLEMFTIVEPKVLNSLVERVFQSNSKVENNKDYFILNKDVNIDQDLKSEIYGSEEKLVEFLEQLLPGMALVDTSKPVNAEKAEGSDSKDGNLPLLPLPEKENVIQDVLKRLEAGENVQIVAKVGDEKIRLDISKVTPKENEVETFAKTFIRKLNNIEKPSGETASAKKVKTPSIVSGSAVENSIENTDSVKSAASKNNNSVNGTEVTGISKEVTETVEVNEKVNVALSESENSGKEIKVTADLKASDEQKANSQVKVNSSGEILTDKSSDKKVDLSKEAEVLTTEKKLSEDVIQTTDEKVAVKIDKNISNVSVKSSAPVVENKTAVDESSFADKEKKSDSDVDLKTVKTEAPKISSADKTDSSIKEEILKSMKKNHVDSKEPLKNQNVDLKNTSTEAVKTAEITKPADINYFEASRINLQQKSFNSLKSEKDTKEDKYKIEITQESSEDKTHDIIKKSNLEVDNLMNYKNQSSKVNNNSPAKAVNAQQPEVQEQIAKEEIKKGEQKVDKLATDAKISQAHESLHNVKPDTGMEKILKNTAPLKEVTKTVNSGEIIKEIKTFIQAGEQKTMILKLMPENLGKMKVMLDLSDNKHVHANIEVENESVKQLIMSNVETLKQTISQSGLQLSGFSVSLSSNPEQKMKREFEQKKKEQGGVADLKVDKMNTTEIKEKKLGYNTYEYLA